MSDHQRCPTCGQPVGPWKETRICGLCHKPVRKGHKWQVVNSMIQHRVCEHPDSYQRPRHEADVSPSPALRDPR